MSGYNTLILIPACMHIEKYVKEYNYIKTGELEDNLDRIIEDKEVIKILTEFQDEMVVSITTDPVKYWVVFNYYEQFELTRFEAGGDDDNIIEAITIDDIEHVLEDVKRHEIY